MIFGSALPSFLAPARRVSVRGRLISFLLLIGILFGGVLSPAMAHAPDSGVLHVGEVLDVHEDAAPAAHDPTEKAPTMPEQPASHHHCTIALEVTAPSILAELELREAQFRPALSRVLASYAQAPPTEPPAA